MDLGFKMCLFPTRAMIPEEGGRPKLNHEGDLLLPCGKCTECIKSRAIDWATRCKHEISLHDDNCFITLTYNKDNLPSHQITKEPFKKFMKRLRKHAKRKLSYIVSHEYGSENYRPHHHCIIFGYNFNEQKFLKKTKSQEAIFTSEELDKLWGQGFTSIGTANEKTAYYIASYALKGKNHEFLHDGELITCSDSMDVSRNPGIGLNYLRKNYQQLVDSKTILPRYYKKKLAEIDEQKLMEYENNIQTNDKTAHQKYAKYILDQKKQSLDDNEFRTAPGFSESDRILRKNLRTDVLHYQRNKSETF